jgi:hypothetical protein
MPFFKCDDCGKEIHMPSVVGVKHCDGGLHRIIFGCPANNQADTEGPRGLCERKLEIKGIGSLGADEEEIKESQP